MHPLPTDALVFKFPKGLATAMLVCSLMFLGFIGLGVWQLAADPGRGALLVLLFCLGVFGPFFAYSIYSFQKLRDSVAVSSEGVWYIPRRGTSRFIAWKDVSAVMPNDVLQRLVLRDTTGNQSISLEYQLRDFGQLRTFVLQHVSAVAHSDHSREKVFHRTWINKSILSGGMLLCLGFAWLSYRDGQTSFSLFFVAFSVLEAIGIVRDPLRVVASRDALVVQYLGWHRLLRWEDITAIRLKDVNQQGNVWAGVFIESKGGKPIKLFRFREGSLALYQCLESAWRSVVGSA